MNAFPRQSWISPRTTAHVGSRWQVLLLTEGVPKSDQTKAPQHILQEIRFLANLPLDLHVLTDTETRIEIPNVKLHVLPQTGREPRKVVRSMLFGLRQGHLGAIRPTSREYIAAKKNMLVYDIIMRERIDLVHSHWAYPEGTGGTWAAKAAGVPVIMTLRGVDINKEVDVGYGYRLDPAYERTLTQSLSLADRITVASKYSQACVHELIPANGKTRILPNGVDLHRFTSPDDSTRRAVREALFLDDRFTLFSLGGLVQNKRFGVVIQALALLQAREMHLHCVICGEGPERKRLEGLTAAVSLQQVVSLAGAVHFDDVPKYYAACDAFVFASAAEGFGNVILEAMAMGKPVVTTPVGFARDIIRDGVNGLLVPFNDPQAIADRIAFLMDNPEEARRMGERAHADVVPKYSIENRVKAFYELYLECLEEKGRNP